MRFLAIINLTCTILLSCKDKPAEPAPVSKPPENRTIKFTIHSLTPKSSTIRIWSLDGKTSIETYKLFSENQQTAFWDSTFIIPNKTTSCEFYAHSNDTSGTSISALIDGDSTLSDNDVIKFTLKEKK